jgi:SWIM zinc finger
MVMTNQQLDERARQRAVSERLHTFKLAGQPLYLVRSRGTEPGAMHQVHVSRAGVVDDCTCKGWEYRRVCTHAAAVTRRLEREARGHRTNASRAAAA